MKNILALTLLASSCVAFTFPARAADPCQQVLCLYGVMKDVGIVKGCSGAVADYFSIVDMKHGSFLPDHTSRSRKKQLDKCPSVDGTIIKMVNDKFGRLRSL